MPTHVRRVYSRNNRLPMPQLAPAPSSQNTRARTYRSTTYRSSHDRLPSTTPATSPRLAAAAATAKTLTDAAAVATVGSATTVAITSDLRHPRRPHLPHVSQRVAESRPPHPCGQGHKLRREPPLQDCLNQLVRSGADPLPVCVSVLSWGTLRATCIRP